MVDKPPSKAAVPPHRIRLEAATQSSLETSSTPAGVPTKCRPFVDASGDVGRMSVGAGGSRHLGGWATPSVVGGRPYSLPLMPLTRRSTITRRTGSGPALLHVGSSYHVTGAAYSCERGGRITQLQYLLQLSLRSSQKIYSTRLGESLWSGFIADSFGPPTMPRGKDYWRHEEDQSGPNYRG